MGAATKEQACMQPAARTGQACRAKSRESCCKSRTYVRQGERGPFDRTLRSAASGKLCCVLWFAQACSCLQTFTLPKAFISTAWSAEKTWLVSPGCPNRMGHQRRDRSPGPLPSIAEMTESQQRPPLVSCVRSSGHNPPLQPAAQTPRHGQPQTSVRQPTRGRLPRAAAASQSFSSRGPQQRTNSTDRHQIRSHISGQRTQALIGPVPGRRGSWCSLFSCRRLVGAWGDPPSKRSSSTSGVPW